MIIFGIDPGTATTGYGVIKSDVNKRGNGFEFVEYGCIITPKEHEMPLRLYSIQKELQALLGQHKPDCVVVEQLFFGVNSRTAMTVGQARGVVLAAAASYRIPVFEYQGLHVKNVLTGSGKSDKKDIQKMVIKYLGVEDLTKALMVVKGLGKTAYVDDAADALAVAICHVIKINNGEDLSVKVKTKKVTKVAKESKSKKRK